MELPNIQIKKILYATDLSENAVHAFAYAVSLANLYGAGITILHVLAKYPGEEFVTNMISAETPMPISSDGISSVKPRLRETTMATRPTTSPSVARTVPAARRASTPTADPVRRRSNFEEANLAFSAEEARRETQRCLNCGACYRKCPQGAITAEGMDPRRIDQEKCIKCAICYDACKFDAILIK